MLKSLTAALVFGIAVVAAVPGTQDRRAEDPWVEYVGGAGPGEGRHIVLVSGDEEYRSEEALPQLGKILARQHGFRCTVLFAIDPKTGCIDPNVQDNIPGLDALDTADLMILFTRYRSLPDSQMEAIDRYLKRGGPVMGIRTATHAFRFDPSSRWSRYSNDYAGDLTEWTGGFGRLVLGERWVRHHGEHKQESTFGIIAADAREHPIVRGLRDRDIWGPTDVYAVRIPLPGDSRPLVLGEVIRRRSAYDENDPFYGMRPDDGPPDREKNSPMMPVAWTKSYRVPGGQTGRAFASTIGASTDLASEGTRRLLVNAVYWCLGMEDEIPAGGTRVDLVGPYPFTRFEFRDDEYWRGRGMKPADYR